MIVSKPVPDAMRALIQAILIETVCIGGGIAAFLMTDNLVWLFAGILLGAGFTLPALITFLRARR